MYPSWANGTLSDKLYNQSTWENSSTTEGNLGPGDLALAPITARTRPLIGLSVLIMTTALTLNSFVLYAISKSGDMKKNVKFLIQNSVCADMLLAIGCGTRFVPLVLGHLLDDGFLLTMCLETFYTVLIGYSAICQTFCSISVAIDRLYSVLNPVHYYTTSYNRCVRVLFGLFSWVLSLALAIPSVWIDWASGVTPPNGHPCYVILLPDSFIYYSTIVPAIVWAGLVVTITMYIVIFVIIYASRAKMSEMNDSKKDSKLIGKSWSMAVTFFLVQVTYLACYGPSTLMTMNLTPLEGFFPPVDLFLNLAITDVYMMNSVIDPLVYVLRVQQVRECFKSLVSRRSGSHMTSRSGELSSIN